jgi:hypothetical protein
MVFDILLAPDPTTIQRARADNVRLFCGITRWGHSRGTEHAPNVTVLRSMSLPLTIRIGNCFSAPRSGAIVKSLWNMWMWQYRLGFRSCRQAGSNPKTGVMSG